MAKFLKPATVWIVFCVLTATTSVTAKTTPTPIYFGKNQISKVWSGKLLPTQDGVVYQFNASKNQYTTLQLLPRRGYAEFANVGVITSPTGKSDGSKGGIVYQGCLPETGTYTLRIGRNLMATHGGTAGFIAKLTILPIRQSQQQCQ